MHTPTCTHARIHCYVLVSECLLYFFLPLDFNEGCRCSWAWRARTSGMFHSVALRAIPSTFTAVCVCVLHPDSVYFFCLSTLLIKHHCLHSTARFALCCKYTVTQWFPLHHLSFESVAWQLTSVVFLCVNTWRVYPGHADADTNARGRGNWSNHYSDQRSSPCNQEFSECPAPSCVGRRLREEGSRGDAPVHTEILRNWTPLSVHEALFWCKHEQCRKDSHRLPEHYWNITLPCQIRRAGSSRELRGMSGDGCRISSSVQPFTIKAGDRYCSPPKL